MLSYIIQYIIIDYILYIPISDGSQYMTRLRTQVDGSLAVSSSSYMASEGTRRWACAWAKMATENKLKRSVPSRAFVQDPCN